jgi:hypothetical protein
MIVNIKTGEIQKQNLNRLILMMKKLSKKAMLLGKKPFNVRFPLSSPSVGIPLCFVLI